MSTVSSANGRNEQTDEIRKMREEYRKKEAELVKKQNKEIAALNQKHDAEIGRTEKQHAAELGTTREKTQETITQRDAKYQKDIEELRKLQSKQLERLTQENQEKIDAQRNATTSELKDVKLSKNDREQDLLKKYNDQSGKVESKFASEVEELRQNEVEAINSQKEAMNKKHAEEIERLRNERNEKVAALEGQNRELYSSSSQQLKDQEVRHFADNRRLQDAHLATTKKEEMAQNQLMAESREGFQDSLHDLRTRFAQQHDRDAAGGEEARQKFHDDVNSRVEGQVNRLEIELGKERDKNVLEETKSQAAANREVRKIRDAYQNKYEMLEKARNDILNETNDRVGQKVKVVHDEADKQMATNTHYYMDQMQMENFKNRQAREQMVQDYDTRQKYQESQANVRVDKVRSDSVNAENELKNNFQSSAEVQKAGFEEKKQDIVYNAAKDKNQSLARLHEQAAKQEVESQQVLNTVINKYEKRISDLNDQIIRERRLRDNHDRQVIKGLNRQHESELESVQMKYENNSKQMEVAHQREMKEADQRQQQKLDEVLTSVKKQT